MQNNRASKLFTTKALVLGAICAAASFVLSYLKIYHFPQGGSVTLFSMLPVMFFAYLYGLLPGLLVGLVYSFLQIIQGAYFLNIWQFLLDYFVAFTALGLAGALTPLKLDDRIKLPLALALGGMARCFASFLSGVIFFGEYAPAGQSPILYSLTVNLTVIGTDTALCVIGGVAIAALGLVKYARSTVR